MMKLIAVVGLFSFLDFSSSHRIYNSVPRGNIVCYYINTNGVSLAPPETLDPKLCTHINYAFVAMDKNGNLTAQNPILDIHQGMYKRVTNLKKRNPKLKVLLSLGGVDASVFSSVAANSKTRENVVESAKYFIETYSFDGLDIDWEKPLLHDAQPFIELLKDLRQEFDYHGWILSAAVYPNPCDGYNITEMTKYLDMFNLMCYNYYGPWSAYTGQNSPLYESPIESAYEKRHLNTAVSIKNWLNAGAPRNKINVGMPFYGRSFTLVDPQNHVLHSPVIGAGKLSTPTYRQICVKYTNWTTVWDNDQKNHYKYSGDQWLGYDDERSIREKAQYVVSEGLAGAMIWHIGADDVSGDCGQKQVLLNIIYNETNKIL